MELDLCYSQTLDTDDPEDSLETVEFSVGSDESKRYQFGETCLLRVTQNDDEKTVPLADHVWPVEHYFHVDDEQWGVRLVWRDGSGDLQASLCPQGAFTSKSEARREAARLASEGVPIRTGRGAEFVMGLGHWLEQANGIEVAKLTRTPGWHDECQVYCNGEWVWSNDETWYADSMHISIRRRSHRAGSAVEWSMMLDKLGTTPGLRAAVGVSLAGPLVDLIHQSSFLVHLFGPSSTGKSTGLELGGSVWGEPQTIRNSWNNTVNALEGLAVVADGGCLLLDELGQFRGADHQLALAIYNIASQQGRNRATRAGGLQEQRHWALTGLSTGEISMKDRVGSHRKGGQDVRMLDVPVRMGDVTEDADHADAIKAAVGLDASGGEYGQAGDAWTKWLQSELPVVEASKRRDSRHEALASDLADGAEDRRILHHCALIGAALDLASEVEVGRRSLVPWSQKQRDAAVRWLARRCIHHRTETTPQERALSLLREKVQTQPHRFPTAQTIKEDRASGEIWGVRDRRDIYISQKLLKASGVPREAGVGVQNFLKWLDENGHAENVGRKMRAGIRCIWYELPMDKGGSR
ncbi:MAG: DUF927 domain-containing protein [Bradymonadaceae bacterium]